MDNLYFFAMAVLVMCITNTLILLWIGAVVLPSLVQKMVEVKELCALVRMGQHKETLRGRHPLVIGADVGKNIGEGDVRIGATAGGSGIPPGNRCIGMGIGQLPVCELCRARAVGPHTIRGGSPSCKHVWKEEA